MSSGYAPHTRTRAKRDAGANAEEKLWKRRLERERIENAKLRARVEELEEAAVAREIVKDKAARPKQSRKVRPGTREQWKLAIVVILEDVLSGLNFTEMYHL